MAQRVVYSALIAFMPILSWMSWVYMLRHRSRMYHTYKELCIQLGVMMRSVLINAIYRKSFVLSSASRCSINSGELTNLMSSDSYFVPANTILHT